MFCTKRGLDWEGAREMMEVMLEKRFLCECEMVWRLKDEQVGERLGGWQGKISIFLRTNRGFNSVR